MVEAGSYDSQFINVGGVQLKKSQVHMIEQPEDNSNRYLVLFKNGTAVSYPEQPAKNGAKIDSDNCQTYKNKSNTNRIELVGLNDAKMVGNEKKRDEIYLFNCTNCDVNVADKKSKFSTMKSISDSIITYNTPGITSDNLITMDYSDTFNNKTPVKIDETKGCTILVRPY